MRQQHHTEPPTPHESRPKMPQITPGPFQPPATQDQYQPSGHTGRDWPREEYPGGMHSGVGQPKPKNRAKFIIPAAAAAVALAAGIGIGAGSAPAAETPTPAPAPTVTQQVTETKNVYRTPQSCLTALDLNEAAFGYASDSMSAILDKDFVAANAATAKIKALTAQINQAKTDCRAGK